jgi:hypothetical protein
MKLHTQPFAYLYLALVFLTACASLGIAPAQSFNQKLAYAYGIHTAVLQATTQSVKTGTLSSHEASQILDMADQSKVLLDSAGRLSLAGDPVGASNRLALASAALSALQNFLNAHGSK